MSQADEPDDDGDDDSSDSAEPEHDYPPTSAAAPLCSAENIIPVSADVSSDEADDEEVHHACEKAEEVYEFVTLPHKVCHCKCQLHDGGRCIGQFTCEEQDEIKMNMREMTSYEKDLMLFGII